MSEQLISMSVGGTAPQLMPRTFAAVAEVE
jgi:hypothetical protein